jgi:hypothetical protein
LTFGWQGFSIEHPEDWAPVSLTGNRAEGYARIASPGRTCCQVRWKKIRQSGDLSAKIKPYFAKLQRDAKRAKQSFRSETEANDSGIVYRWVGAGQGRGALFFSESCSRVFFLEVVGGRKDSLLPVFGSVQDSFHSADGERELWSLYGLRLSLPKGLRVEMQRFHAGRTTLVFKARGARITAERWAFAEQLVQKHGLEPWARASLNLPKAKLHEAEQGLELSRGGVLPVHALVAQQEESNQLVTVRVTGISKKWRPSWDWLD